MAKATLEFDLNETDDIKAHIRCVKSLDMAIALWDITQIRKKLKNELEFDIKHQSLNKYEIVDLVCDKIHEIFSDHNIDIDELMD